MADVKPDIRAIFWQVLDRKSPEDQAQYLDAACADDADLRCQVEELLNSMRAAGRFLGGTLSSPLPPTLMFSTEPVGTSIGPYKLREVLGEGGMGIVYAAEQEQPIRRRVALKIIKPGMDSKEIIGRFSAERQALALMDHPNIAKVLDAGTTESGRPYFVMEFVRGMPITEYCDRAKLPLRERLKLFITVCQAIQHAHQKGIIHRDLKPSNVMITLHDGTPVPKVIDFGVAKALNQRLTEQTVYTRAASLVGTPMYMSPEQAELSGLDVDTRSDVYALGTLLYELLTGHTPFDKERLSKAGYDELRRIIREDEPPRPSQRVNTLTVADSTTVSAQRGIDARKLQSTLHGELDWIVMKALEKDRNRRYESASAFAADVERYLTGEAVEACPPSAAYRLKKFVRRNSVALVTTGLVAVALVVGTSVSVWQAVEATQARQLADERLDLANARLKRETKALEEADTQRQEALTYRQRAEHVSARAQLELGTRLLNEGDSRGLLEVVEACLTAERLPDMSALTADVWSVAHQMWEGKLTQVLPGAESIAFHPGGHTLAIGSESTAYLFDVQTGRSCALPMNLGKQISVVAFSPDGKLLATHSVEGVARLWDAATGNPTSPALIHEHSGISYQNRRANHLPSSAAFHPGGHLLATGGSDGTVRLWRTPGGEPSGDPLRCQSAVTSLAFSPDGSKVAASTFVHKGLTYLWSVETRELLLPPLTNGVATDKILFNPSGKHLASIATNGIARIWDVTNGDIVNELRLTEVLEDFQFDKDGGRIALGTTGRTATLWKWTDNESYADLEHQGRVRGVAFSPNGKLVATASADQTARLWDSETGKPASLPLRHQSEVFRARFSPDGGVLVTAGTEDEGKGGNTRVWNVDSTAWEPFREYDNSTQLIVSPDLARLATVSTGHDELKVCRAAGHEVNCDVIPLEPDSLILCVTFSPDSRVLAISTTSRTGAADTTRFWDLHTNGYLPQSFQGSRIIACGPDGRYFANGTAQWRVNVWDQSSEMLVADIFCHEAVGAIAFSPDGQHLATGNHGGKVQQWNVPEGTPYGPALTHPGRVLGVAYNPNGRLLASVANLEGNYSARIWFLGAGPPCPHLVLSCRPTGNLVQFSSDGDLLLCGETPGTFIRWRINHFPTSLSEIQSRTWKVLGLRRSNDGEVKAIPWQEWQKIGAPGVNLSNASP